MHITLIVQVGCWMHIHIYFFDKKFQLLPSQSNPWLLESISATTWKWPSAYKSSRNSNSDFYMYYADIYAAQHYTDPILEQSGGSERKKFRIFLKFDFGSWFYLLVFIWSSSGTLLCLFPPQLCECWVNIINVPPTIISLYTVCRPILFHNL